VHASHDDIMARAKARLGTVLRGKYKLDRILGAGGMAVVYAATHRNQMRVAVKMLHPELSLSADIRTRFLREGYAANSVHHEGALKVLDDDVAEDGAAFLVMELLEGAAAEEHWERHRHQLPLKATIALGHELCDVLVAAHAKGIVHRDLKPANLFITNKGELKVLDFGIARVRDAATGGSSSGPAYVTGTGMLLGTPAFMPPEQARAQASQMDGQTDQWAVGATMFTLLTGRLVHTGDNASQLMIAAATEAAPTLRSVLGSVPPQVAAIVDRALAFQKADRWPSTRDMRDALARVYQSTFGEVVSTAPLRALFSEPEDPIAPTTASGTGPAAAPVPSFSPARSAEGAQKSPEVPRSRAPDAAPQPSLNEAGLSTAKPISSDRTPAGVPRRSPAIALGIGAGVLLLVGVGAAVKFGSSGGAPSQASVSATMVASSRPPEATTPATPVLTAALAPLDTPTPAPSPSLAVGPSPVTPAKVVIHPRTTPAAPASTTATATATLAPTSIAPAPAPPPPAPTKAAAPIDDPLQRLTPKL
jgi:serine/threonine-protein kinase